MQVTIASGTPEELTQFFKDKQEKLPAKVSLKSNTRGRICKWNGSGYDVTQRQIPGELNYGANLQNLSELIKRIAKED